MWLYFNNRGQLLESLEHGSAARSGDTAFEIFAVFEDVTQTNANTFSNATIKLRKPDLDNNEYPTMLMESAVTKTFTLAAGETSQHFTNGTAYTGFYFNFNNVVYDPTSTVPEIIVLLDTPGLWTAIITLIGSNSSLNVQGVATFNVANGTVSQDNTEVEIDAVLNQIYAALGTKLNIKSPKYIHVVNTLVGVTSFSSSEYDVNDVLFDKNTRKVYKILSLTTAPLTEVIDLGYGYALDTAVVHKTGDETVGGTKTFTSPVNVGSNPINFANNAAISGNSSVELKVSNEDNKYTFGTNSITHKSGTTTHLGSSEVPFNNAYLSENLILSGNNSDIVDGSNNPLYVKTAGGSEVSGNTVFEHAFKDDTDSDNEFITKSVTDALGVRIDNITASGRYLAAWDCSVPSVDSLPGGSEVETTTEVYNYKTGDYYIISAVGSGTNYMPNGTNLPIGTTKTTVPNVATGTTQIGVGDAWRYNGSTWTLEINSQKDIPISRVVGLQATLDSKLGNESPELTSMGNTNKSVATKEYVDDHAGGSVNIRDGSGTGALQQIQDGTSGVVDFTDKNPNATALDPTITGNIPYGGTGQYSSSLGGKSVAQGKRSHSEGTTTLAKGNYSHAEGDNSVSLGNDSHAEGYATVSGGTASHSEGRETVANAFASHASGVGTYAYHDAQTVVGKYNKKNAGNQLFTVGNGTNDNARNDAFEVYEDGTVKFGSLTDGTTTKTVTQILNNAAIWGNITGTLNTQSDLWAELQDIRAVAEGKTKSIVIDTTDTSIDTSGAIVYCKSDGTGMTVSETQAYVSGLTNYNTIFELTTDTIDLAASDKYYIFSGIDSVHKMIVLSEEFLGGNGPFKTGDIVLVVKVEVPDRWYSGMGVFSKLESKIDLSNYYAKNASLIPSASGFDIGSASKTFNNLFLTGNISDGTNTTSVAKINNNLADTYSSSSAYAVGDLVIHEGSLYKCNTTISSPGESWTAGHWDATSISANVIESLEVIAPPADSSHLTTAEQLKFRKGCIVKGEFMNCNTIIFLPPNLYSDVYHGMAICTDSNYNDLIVLTRYSMNGEFLDLKTNSINISMIGTQPKIYSPSSSGFLLGGSNNKVYLGNTNTNVYILNKLFPFYPTTDGNYHLRDTVSNGSSTLSWSEDRETTAVTFVEWE